MTKITPEEFAEESKKSTASMKRATERYRRYLAPPMTAPNSEIARTDDGKKPPLAWLPPEGIRAVARVQAYGHLKYGEFDNYRKGMEVSRNCSCAMRHIVAFMDGETLDPESGENHLSHACCRLMFVLQNMKDGVAIDDRYVRKNKTT